MPELDVKQPFGFRTSGIYQAIENLKETIDRADLNWDEGKFIYSVNIDVSAVNPDATVKMHMQWLAMVKIVDTYGLDVIFEDYTCSSDKFATAKFNDWLVLQAWATEEEMAIFKEGDR